MKCQILEIKNLSIQFSVDGQLFDAVTNFSFSLKKGETIGIVGESGSGKSISSLAIMGLLPPSAIISSGEIIFHESEEHKINLLHADENYKRHLRGNKIAMIFQEPMTSLNPVFTCGNQVVEAILAHNKISKKQAKEKVLHLFSEVLLPDPEKAFNSYPFQLSGGQKQRVMIAMAMSCNPSLIIADEPTTALDVTVQKTILELLKNLQAKYNLSIIFISHDLGVIADIAHRVLVMYKGKIMEEGKTRDLLSNPQNAYTKGLLACRPSTVNRVKTLAVVSDFLDGKEHIPIIISNEERKIFHENIYEKDPILKITNLKVVFPVKKNMMGKTTKEFIAVNNVSFDVYKGETLGLVGESGCGKTTLGRTILQLTENAQGDIHYNEIALNKLSSTEIRKFRKKIQIIFQDPYSSLNPRLTVGDTITEPMIVHGIGKNNNDRKQIALELLQKVGLESSHYARYPHEFSGGQRQRISIARALAVQPEFIICDESVSALDVSVQAQVLNLLNSLKEEFKLTFIFISHDLSVVKYMSDRMVVMQNGQIEEMGEADQIYNSPEKEYTKKLIGAIPLIKISETVDQ